MLRTTVPEKTSYVLGHSATELQRLIDQSRFFGDLTAHMLQLAGLRAGMQVIDVGCGVGDVSFLAARFVGPSGTVIGIDASEEAIQVARQRATTAGLTNVTFRVADLTEVTLDGQVDAVIGRLVLMYLPDPAVAVRRLASLVHPGGIVAFQEINVDHAQSEPHCPLFEGTVQHVRDAFTRAGVNHRMGLTLGTVFEEAGLPPADMILGARVERGPDSLLYSQLAGVIRSLLPVIVRTGIASDREIDIETLADRLRDEAVEQNATLISPSFIGAWVRLPEVASSS